MTITVTSLVAGPLVATGAAQDLPFNFKVFSAEEVEVYWGDLETVVDPADYTVARNMSVAGDALEGGTVTLGAGVVAAGENLYVRAVPEFIQDQEYSSSGTRLENLNEALDRGVLRDIHIRDRLVVVEGVVDDAVGALIGGALATVNEAGAVQVTAIGVAGDAKLTAIGAAGDAELTAIGVAGSAEQADIAEAGALQLAAITSLPGSEQYASVADALSQGVVSVAITTAGTGGTDGTYAWSTTGGGGTEAAGWLVIAGGVITEVGVTHAGRGYTSAPTIVIAGTPGVTGHALTPALAQNETAGAFFVVSTALATSLYKVDGGGATATFLRDLLDNEEVEAALAAITDTLSDYETLGRPVASPPIVGTGLGAGYYIHAKAFENSGNTLRMRLKGAGTKTVPLQLYEGAAGSLVEVGTPYDLLVTAGDKEFTITAADFGLSVIEAGMRWGINPPIGAAYYTVNTADDTGYYFGATAAAVKADTTPSTTTRLEVGADLFYQVTTASRDLRQDADIVDLQATQADHDARLTVLDSGLVTQIIGAQGALQSSGTASGGTTFVIGDPAIGHGRARRVELSAKTAGTLYIKAMTPGVSTWEQPDVDLEIPCTVGLNDHTFNLPYDDRQVVGYYFTGTIYYAVGDGFSGGYKAVAGNQTSVAFPIVTTNVVPAIRFTLEVARTDQWEVNVANSDVLAFPGDSMTEGAFCVENKGPLAWASLLSDWRFSNFAASGETAAENLARIRADATTLGTLAYKNRGATYSVISVMANDANSVSPVTTVPDYALDMRQLIETVRGLGSVPVVWEPITLEYNGATRFTYGYGYNLISRTVAEQSGCLYIEAFDVARRNDYGTRHPDLWNGAHTGSRTAWLQNASLLAWLGEIGAPLQSVKILMKRAGVTATTAADLIFNTPFERAKLFQEIRVGTGALVDPANVDNISTGAAPVTELLPDQYDILINGGTIALGEWSAMSVVLPVYAKHIDQLNVVLNVTDATLYVRNIMGGTVVDGDPLGGMLEIKGAAGVYQMSNSQIKRFMREDRLDIVIYRSGGIAAFAMPRFRGVGPLVEKPVRFLRKQSVAPLGVEALTNTDLGVLTGKTVVGSVTPVLAGADATACPPIGSTGYCPIDNSNYIKVTATWAADDTRSREVIISVNARTFPTFDTGITEDSFDLGQLLVEIGNDAGRVPHYVTIGPWWYDYPLRAILPLGTTTLDVYIRGAAGEPLPLQASKVSVKLMEA